MERRHEMEYDSRPDKLVHEAVEEAVNASPRLALEPYYQMKEAARILAERLIKYREEQFSPLGDNHHNAAKCPYCTTQPVEAA